MRSCVVATGLAVAGLCLCASAAQAGDELGAKAKEQIAALQDIKRSLSPAERKLDSRLVVALRERQRSAMTAAVPQLSTGVDVAKGGTTEVDVRATTLSGDLLDRLEAAGAEITYASKRLESVRARVPLAALERVARGATCAGSRWPSARSPARSCPRATWRTRPPRPAPAPR